MCGHFGCVSEHLSSAFRVNSACLCVVHMARGVSGHMATKHYFSSSARPNNESDQPVTTSDNDCEIEIKAKFHVVNFKENTLS